MKRTVFLAAGLACTACTSVAEAPRLGSADHHVHIRSEAGAAQIARIREEFGGGSPSATVAVGAGEAIEALDEAGIEGALILSNAYMFGMPGLEPDDERALVRAENDYVASEVEPYAHRLIALCSVNPLRPYALEEVDRCASDPRIGGLKLHLANSFVDLTSEADLSSLATLFRRLESADLPALVHVRTGEEGYGPEEVAAFIDRVLSAAPSIHIQIAHMAGWGGYDDVTDAALGVFANALSDGRLDPDRVVFGLGAVVFNPAAALGDSVLAEQVRRNNERLAGRIREIGPERVVYGTDWPSWPPVQDASTGVARNVEMIRSELPLTDAEMETVFGNVSPMFDRLRPNGSAEASSGP